MNRPVNIHAMNQDIKNDLKVRMKSEEGDNDSDLNPYQMAILNKIPKEDARAEQMINWCCIIFLLINRYTDNNTTKHHSRSMGDNGDLTGVFHQKLSSLPMITASDSRSFQSS